MQPYDDRIFRFLNDDAISIWTLNGREKVACVTGEHQRELLKHRKGEVDLMRVRGVFYVACVCDLDDPDLIETRDVLGVDLGIVNIATDSQGTNHSGEIASRARAVVSQPNGFSTKVAHVDGHGCSECSYKPPALAGGS